jgi:TfoX/Sxy family transcriptional regulator of competence genes
MATDAGFIEHVLDTAGLGDRLTARKMFGEYGFHFEGKFIALACDDSLFIKATSALDRHRLDLPLRPPYPVADELLDDPETLRQLLIDTAVELPPPKIRKKKRSRDGQVGTKKARRARTDSKPVSGDG